MNAMERNLIYKYLTTFCSEGRRWLQAVELCQESLYVKHDGCSLLCIRQIFCFWIFCLGCSVVLLQSQSSRLLAGIFELTLERPETKNAIGRDMLKRLEYTFDAVNKDNTAKVLMISSSVPKVFCAGADLKERKTMSSSEIKDFVHRLRSTFSLLEELNVPTIAVIEGAALGGGLEMALSCDLRICVEDTVLGLPETGLAIIPGAGGTQRLSRLVGKSIAKDLIFTGRKITGRDAVSIGLVNYCVSSGEAHLKALGIARDIIQKGPLAIRMAKRAINGGFEVDMVSALELEENCYEQLLHTKDRLEGLAAFAERRKPEYTGE